MVGDTLCAVQLLHPGAEHCPRDGDEIGWNRRPHKRKFLHSPGAYVSEGGLKEADILFWGEWEPESRIVRRFDNTEPGYPRYVSQPYYRMPASYKGLQNTDPFVFGGFFYTFCLQSKKHDSGLKHMSRGSVVLFGSHVRGHFVLDTVLVVKDFIEHSDGNWRDRLGASLPKEYREVTLEPYYANDGGNDRLYMGSTENDPYDGMYSFFPCVPDDGRPNGFSRPQVELPVVGSLLKQNHKRTCLSAISEARDIWDAVRRQVVQQGLAIGVAAQIPRRAG